MTRDTACRNELSKHEEALPLHARDARRGNAQMEEEKDSRLNSSRARGLLPVFLWIVTQSMFHFELDCAAREKGAESMSPTVVCCFYSIWL